MPQRPKILVIDDDPNYVYLFRRNLNKIEGFEESDIDHCSNGQEALDYFKTGYEKMKSGAFLMPELVFVDINMPVMNGFEFLEQTEAWADSIAHDLNAPPPRFLMFTSSSDPADVERSKKHAYLKAYVIKPYDREGYTHMIKKCMAMVHV